MPFSNCADWTRAKNNVQYLDENSFEKVRELGKSCTNAIVSLVRHKESQILLAQKSIYLDVSNSTISAILMEIQALHRCNCKNIVGFFGAYGTKYGISICMEYMNLGSMTDILKNYGTLPEPCVGWVAVSVLNAIRYLKEDMRILHRDIKPSNILINSVGQVKLCDLGVSKSLVDSTAVTYVGSRSYMAPERLNGQVYGSKSDVWSYGLSMFEAAVGRYPIPPPTRGEFARRFNVPIDEIDEDVDPEDEEERNWLYENNDPQKLSIFDLLTYIVDRNPPKLPRRIFSADFIGFMERCLAYCLKERIVQSEISQLPFIIKHDTDQCRENFERWCANVAVSFFM